VTVLPVASLDAGYSRGIGRIKREAIEREMRDWFKEHGVPTHTISIRVEVRRGETDPEPAIYDWTDRCWYPSPNWQSETLPPLVGVTHWRALPVEEESS
jgi:hypothetical protein